MASGHVYRAQQAEHMAAPTKACDVKKALANPEPSTHGPSPKSGDVRFRSAVGEQADSRQA